MRKLTAIISVLIMFTAAANLARAERIKDIATIQGVRGNPLSGVGLVVGLAGTGDQSLPSQRMLTNVLRRSDLVFSPDDLPTGSIAMVMVTAELGPFDHVGKKIDVDVSAIGDADSLQGGVLLLTELKGADGQVYATAQGSIFLGGFAATGEAATATKNHPTVGRIPGGAYVERSEIATFIENIAGKQYVTLNLRNEDFTTANRMTTAINQLFPNQAHTVDASSVRVKIPPEYDREKVAFFVDSITQQEVKVDMPAIVVINERTGTIVVGEKVGISTVAISQGSLVVKVKESAMVSQPQANFSDNPGQTVAVPDTSIGVSESQGYLIPVNRVVTVSELAKALNAIGATPRDLIAIFNALKQAGALQAELKIM
ncbi:Basal body P-ring protein [Anaerohalosphaera lusitana]|uniref:Flagellar P-ring protein n=1 Tax=Anaerohalosphaera lusitana TaxID=1936003 RepID=A0A1U9NGP0_9BACT|nr:flagellar basal body P-ring protein FlgI [Anaerohalosphaera lusitana]AQT66918.1 Basal body P-ring protein [Anaerohalosphaera lusitana]